MHGDARGPGGLKRNSGPAGRGGNQSGVADGARIQSAVPLLLRTSEATITELCASFGRRAGEAPRAFYAFDPRVTSILFIGGYKTGNDRFDVEYEPVADSLYDVRLEVLRRGLIE